MEMTNREKFDRDGYLFVPQLIENPEDIYHPFPMRDGKRDRGMYIFQKNGSVIDNGDEKQVLGSLARYNVPCYRELHWFVKREVEKILDMDLWPTYFYDRFYTTGQELEKHHDRHACEISVTLQISNNRESPWPIWFENKDGSASSISMVNGDAAIYRGIERDHWREPLTSKYNEKQLWWRRFRKLEDDTYHHQVFFHYVDAQGPHVHLAFDQGWNDYGDYGE